MAADAFAFAHSFQGRGFQVRDERQGLPDFSRMALALSVNKIDKNVYNYLRNSS